MGICTICNLGLHEWRFVGLAPPVPSLGHFRWLAPAACQLREPNGVRRDSRSSLATADSLFPLLSQFGSICCCLKGRAVPDTTEKACPVHTSSLDPEMSAPTGSQLDPARAICIRPRQCRSALVEPCMLATSLGWGATVTWPKPWDVSLGTTLRTPSKE